MSEENKKIPSFDDVARFHGHVCPGLTLGYVAGKAGLEKIESLRDVDEEILTIVENDACGVDAIQMLTGCTLGKGNLIHRDYAKQVFTFICRDTKKAVRFALKPDFDIIKLDSKAVELKQKVMDKTATQEEIEEHSRRMKAVSEKMREMPPEEIFNITYVTVEIPEKARLFNSYICAKCGEMMAESRTRLHDGKHVCIPCYDFYTRGW